LKGNVTDHHRFLLSEHLTQIRHLEEAIERVTTEITRRLTPPEDGAPSQKEEEVTPEMVPDSASQQEPAPSAHFSLSWLQAVVLHGTHSRHRCACGNWDLSRNRDQYASLSQLRRTWHRRLVSVPSNHAQCRQTPLWENA